MKTKSQNSSTLDGILLKGTISVHPKGFAFVSPSDSLTFPEDIFIPKHLKEGAVDGDLVEVLISPERKPQKGPEGKVLSVLKRGKTEMVGVVWRINPKGEALLYIQSLGPSKQALIKNEPSSELQIGDRLVIEIKEWRDEKSPALAIPKKRLGSINDPATDIPSAIIDFGIEKSFPPEVLTSVKELPSEVRDEDLIGREDFTALETFTIDPDTARDFDDALSLTLTEEGHYHLAVHIADVSHYVKEGTPLDLEAQKRANSTYFPGECVPMLPEELSNHLCSLKSDLIRLTLSVLMEFDATGSLLSSQIVRGFIKSQKRFTYKEAKMVLDKTIQSPHYPTLKEMEKLCHLLKAKRFERGSIDLALSEVVIQVDSKGKPTGHEKVDYDITHQLVEEFMLKANEVVAKAFSNEKRCTIFRIHEPPNEENFSDFFSLARSMGFFLPSRVEAQDIQKVFEMARATPHLDQLSIAYIRSMKLAIYSHENLGHYGLALENYCHFTSPIRRYSDLIVHRRLFEKEESHLPSAAKYCSERERISFKAEMSVLLLKKLRLLKQYQDEDPHRVYSSMITKIKPFGIYFEVPPIQYEGFLSLSSLHDDYYAYNRETNSLAGVHTGKGYKVGTSIEVQIEKIDFILMESKWTLNAPQKKLKKRSSKGKTSFKSRKKR